MWHDRKLKMFQLKRRLGLGTNPAVKKVDLPRFGYSYAGRTATVSGFGYTKLQTRLKHYTWERIEGEGSSDNKLKYAYVDLFSNGDCGAKLGYNINPKKICGQVKQRILSRPEGICYVSLYYRLSQRRCCWEYNYYIDDDYFCFISWQGDSGSPLVVDNVQVGVTSTGVSFCEESKQVAQYTRVSSFLSFIDAVLNGKLWSSEVRIIAVK